MKKLISIMCLTAVIFSACTSSINASDSVEEIISNDIPTNEIKLFNLETNYTELMVDAAVSGDIELGKRLERERSLKKEYLGISDDLTFADLYLLAKIVEVEAGSTWIAIEHKKLVASVVINRVNSPEFPNTVYDVVYQENQYADVGTEWFNSLVPSESSVRVALDVLLNGSIAPETVVFQAEFEQGSKIYKTFSPKRLGITYFCHSSYPELYED